ncbi:hypothetical protein M0R45_015860 [Rubus argutus]|uniref:LRAT domain-containing protein n=1 Tax=Rubus argutus TaxID=59490 RepID=A0AAW1XRS7_RUBAR
MATPYAASNTASLTPATLISWPGTCTTDCRDPPDNIISRANDLLNNKDGFGDYHFITNNCEVFAVFCSTGKRVCFQACSFGFNSA